MVISEVTKLSSGYFLKCYYTVNFDIFSFVNFHEKWSFQDIHVLILRQKGYRSDSNVTVQKKGTSWA